MPIQIDLADIAELPTQIAMHGAIRPAEMVADDLFEIVVAVVNLVVETM